MLSHRMLLLWLVGALLGSTAVAQEPLKQQKNDAAAQASEPPDHAALEQQFQETLSGARLVGNYSIVGQDNERPPQEEKYTILRATKLQGDLWLLTARIQFGEQDVAVPLPLEVKWAGDTPVISVTDVTIPGLGTFTARVMVFRGRYAGTWQHGNVGGHLWGRLTKENQNAEKKAAE